MSLTPGTRLGPVRDSERTRRRRRMSEVYKPRDSRLDCFVAIKGLPPVFASDPTGLPGSTEKPKRSPLSHTVFSAFGLSQGERPACPGKGA